MLFEPLIVDRIPKDRLLEEDNFIVIIAAIDLRLERI